MGFVGIVQQGNIERWTLCRPERMNALGTSLAGELSECVAELGVRAAAGSAPRALVITAEPVLKGPNRIWVAGGDLKELDEIDSAEGAQRYAAMLTNLLEAFDELPLLVVIAVDGAAIGGGAELALGGDLRIATSASSLSFKQLRVGLATGYGGAKRLVDAIGLSRAQRLVFLGETLDAQTALNFGLFHRVVPDLSGLDALVTALVAEVGRESVAAQKAMFRLAVRAHPGAAQAGELEIFGRLWRNPGHAAFLQGFGEKGRKTGKETKG